jgi:plasmid stabilization system protein ParE
MGSEENSMTCPKVLDDLVSILDYIADDSPKRALNFVDKLGERLS